MDTIVVRLQSTLENLRDCNWTIEIGDRMDPVYEITHKAIDPEKTDTLKKFRSALGGSVIMRLNPTITKSQIIEEIKENPNRTLQEILLDNACDAMIQDITKGVDPSVVHVVESNVRRFFEYNVLEDVTDIHEE